MGRATTLVRVRCLVLVAGLVVLRQIRQSFLFLPSSTDKAGTSTFQPPMHSSISSPNRSDDDSSQETSLVDNDKNKVTSNTGFNNHSSRSSSAGPSLLLKQEKRTKAHFCMFPNHMRMPMGILKSTFGFQQVDATKDDDWDLIYGGYPHCGTKRFDWDMTSGGLNGHLANQGWSNLKPHQIWFPCMGCKQSYCNKRGLCELIRESYPDECYILPDDYERLSSKFDGKKVWVHKVDGPNLHLHMSTGISYIKHVKELPKLDGDDGAKNNEVFHMVQPYHEPYLGTGVYKRKSEIRIYLAVTSVFPLRAYAYDKVGVSMSPSIFEQTGSLNDTCMHATRPQIDPKCPSDLSKHERCLTLEQYANKVHWNKTQQDEIMNDALVLLSSVLKSANPFIQTNEINKGINVSDAQCFSYMRADMGITAQGKAVLYEINEFPFMGPVDIYRDIKKQSTLDLFYMIGLDQIPIPRGQRADWEASHHGGWQLLPGL